MGGGHLINEPCSLSSLWFFSLLLMEDWCKLGRRSDRSLLQRGEAGATGGAAGGQQEPQSLLFEGPTGARCGSRAEWIHRVKKCGFK